MTENSTDPTTNSHNTQTIDWPDDFDRTPEGDREPYPHNFRVERRDAFRNIITQLSRLGAESVRVETAAEHLKRKPHLPKKGSSPDDPGVVVYFTHEDSEYAVPCDRWATIRDNAQAIARYLKAKRAIGRYGVSTIRSEFSNLELPTAQRTPDDQDVTLDRPPEDVLGVSEDASVERIRQAAREQKANAHPDNGGDRSAFIEIQRAENLLLESKGTFG